MKIAYKKNDSLFHILHPVSQMIICAAILVLPLLNSNPFASLSALLSVGIIAGSSGVFADWISWWRFCLFIFVLSVVINAFVSSNGSTVLLKYSGLPVFGRIVVTAEGLFFGASMGLRISSIILVFAFWAVAVDPDRILNLLSPGSSESALLTAMTMRMVPAVAKDSREILEAQAARGIDLDSGGYIKRMNNRVPLLRKLARDFLDRGISLAEAMESRAYGSGPRSRLVSYVFSPADFGVIAVFAAGLVFVIAVSAMKLTSFDFYPSIRVSTQAQGYACFVFFILVSVVFSVFSALWKNSR